MNLRPYIVEVLGTPEAGKTTTIKEVISSLDSKGYKVNYVRESAEIVPSEFAKGSIDAHIWMRLHTAQSLLQSCASNVDVVIADRGIMDTSTLETFCKEFISVPKYEIDTTGIPVDTVVAQVENTILRNFNNT